MHPFIPFVTEEIWAHLSRDRGALCQQSWPRSVIEELVDVNAEQSMQTIIDLIVAIRNIRATWNISPKQALTLHVSAEADDLALIQQNAMLIQTRTNIESLSAASDSLNVQNCATALIGKIRMAVPLGDLIDLEAEKKRILKNVESLRRNYDSLEKRLCNESFLAKAPEEVVAKERERLEALKHEINELEDVMDNLS